MRTLILTHDLACTFEDLARVAQRYAKSSGMAMDDFAIAADLAIAAVALTVQLAIDSADRDPGRCVPLSAS